MEWLKGLTCQEVARMYPHRFKGEGQFVAKLHDTREPAHRKVKPVKSNLTKDQLNLWQDFAKKASKS